MHGEYKTPGGKLVRIDFDLDGEVLRNVVVSGDFFLYPEEVLEPITAAVDGSPAGESREARAARIHAVIPAGTEWLGTSPEGLAIAIERALSPEEESA